VPPVSWGADGEEGGSGDGEELGGGDCGPRGMGEVEAVGREMMIGVGVVIATSEATQRAFFIPILLVAVHPREVVVNTTAPTAASVTAQTTTTVTHRLAVVANRLTNRDFICRCIANGPWLVTRPEP
jgi:hypothetical protein